MGHVHDGADLLHLEAEIVGKEDVPGKRIDVDGLAALHQTAHLVEGGGVGQVQGVRDGALVHVLQPQQDFIDGGVAVDGKIHVFHRKLGFIEKGGLQLQLKLAEAL